MELGPSWSWRPYDVKAAAAYLGVRESLLRTLIRQRQIPFHKINKMIRLNQVDLDAFLARGRVEPWGEIAVPGRSRRFPGTPGARAGIAVAGQDDLA